jgi:hypothetical protein
MQYTAQSIINNTILKNFILSSHICKNKYKFAEKRKKTQGDSRFRRDDNLAKVYHNAPNTPPRLGDGV